MICPSLPRFHIRKLRTSISNNVEIIRLTTPYFGAYRPVIPAITSALQTYIELEENDVLSSILKLNFGGDGVPFCRTASYILLSFSFPSLNLMYSHEAIHTFAALRGKDDYDAIKNGFAPVLIEINELIENGAIEINGHLLN
uniref:Uncharacterized protein n=1 Tax=Amphimedon queenslandica TaxID=400682 RepID=A0A1X7V6N6_AMPQE